MIFMTIKEAINQGVIMLKNENIESPKIKARVLLEYTLKKSREYLIVYEINKNIIPCIRIQNESNAYRIKWFSQDSPFMKPFRRGGNEDVNDPASEFYKQFNTLNETAFVPL